jgi:hypothetical protein
MSNKDLKQCSLENLADALTEDILNTPDDELLREVEEDYGDPQALARKFDQILERAEKQVFGAAASAQVPSSVLNSPISLPGEAIRWVRGIFDLGSRFSVFLSSLRPHTLAWSATAAVVILVQAAVLIAVLVKEQGESSGPSSAAFEPAPMQIAADATRKLSDAEIAAFVAGGRQLMVAGDIRNARLVLQQAAEADNATAALELGATYDPFVLQQLAARQRPYLVESSPESERIIRDREKKVVGEASVEQARWWYEKAKDLGSTEAAVRLERLRSVPIELWR